MRISKNYSMGSFWTRVSEIVTFAWTEIKGVRLLVPVTLSMDVSERACVDWCRGQITDYHQYRSTARLLVPPSSKKH